MVYEKLMMLTMPTRLNRCWVLTMANLMQVNYMLSSA